MPAVRVGVTLYDAGAIIYHHQLEMKMIGHAGPNLIDFLTALPADEKWSAERLAETLPPNRFCGSILNYEVTRPNPGVLRQIFELPA